MFELTKKRAALQKKVYDMEDSIMRGSDMGDSTIWMG